MAKVLATFKRCSACGHRVYHRVRRCPHCDHRMRWNLKPQVAWALAAAIAVLLGLALADLTKVADRPASNTLVRESLGGSQRMRLPEPAASPHQRLLPHS